MLFISAEKLRHELASRTSSERAYFFFIVFAITVLLVFICLHVLMMKSTLTYVENSYAASSAALDARYVADVRVDRDGLYIDGERRSDCAELSHHKVPVIRCAAENLEQNPDWIPKPVEVELTGFLRFYSEHRG